MQKIVLLAAVLAALFASFAQGADVQMPSTTAKSLDEAHKKRMKATTDDRVMMRTPEDPDADAAGIKILIGTQDLLKQPTALVNQNTIATGNNVAIMRSNIIFTTGTQIDRLALVDTIEALIRTSEEDEDDDDGDDDDKDEKDDDDDDDDDDEKDADSDARLTSAILAVVGAKASDDKMVAQVRAVLSCRKHSRAMLRQCIIALVSTMPSSSSSSATMTPSADASKDEQLTFSYRVVFRYPLTGGFRYGWRYPLSYWNVYGPRFYPAACDFGRVFGPYYYC